MKKKSVATFLALFFGFIGLHRFYLGQRWRGIAHIILGTAVIVFVASTEKAPEPMELSIAFALSPIIISVIDFLVFAFMSKVEFRAKYQLKDLQYMNSLEQQAFLQKKQIDLPNQPPLQEEDFSHLINDEARERLARYGRLYEEGMLTKKEFMSLKRSINQQSQNHNPIYMRKKWHTALWAIFFGLLGFHRFYLGQQWRGIGTIALGILAIICSSIINQYRFMDNDFIIYSLRIVIIMPFILWFIDIVSFLFITKLEFRAKYGVKDLQYMNSLEKQTYLQQNLVSPKALPQQNQTNNFNHLLSEEAQEKIARYGRLYEEGMLSKEEFLSLKKNLKQ